MNDPQKQQVGASAPENEPIGRKLIKLGAVCVICLGLAAGIALVIQLFIS